MHCPTCGKENQDGRKYCARCKTSLKEPSRAGAEQPSGVSTHKRHSTSRSSVNKDSNQKQDSTPMIEVEYASSAKQSSAAASYYVHSSSKAPKRKKTVFFCCAIIIIIIAFLGISFFTDVFKLQRVPVKNSVNDYSWEELSIISDELAQSSDKAAAVEIAKQYNLVLNNGSLDGTQIKEFELTNGEKISAQITGFVHDSKVDGGKAGITFIFCSAITSCPVNNIDTNSGGWEQSHIRSWLATDGMQLLPKDLQAAILPVLKKTNNVGDTENRAAISTTSDMLWLYSIEELTGNITWFQNDEARNELFNSEGTQYKLYSDSNIVFDKPNISLVRKCNNEYCYWWSRSPYPANGSSFCRIVDNGCPYSISNASEPNGIVPGFCI